MNISVAISLSEDEVFELTAEEAAAAVIEALDGASPENDFCNVTVTRSRTGAVGAMPAPPPLPVPDQSLPEPQPAPDQSLPEPQPAPDNTLPADPEAP